MANSEVLRSPRRGHTRVCHLATVTWSRAAQLLSDHHGTSTTTLQLCASLGPHFTLLLTNKSYLTGKLHLCIYYLRRFNFSNCDKKVRLVVSTGNISELYLRGKEVSKCIPAIRAHIPLGLNNPQLIHTYIFFNASVLYIVLIADRSYYKYTVFRESLRYYSYQTSEINSIQKCINIQLRLKIKNAITN